MGYFCFDSGKSEYIEPAKRAHVVPPPRGRGRGGFGQGIRPHDIFRQRKQNTSRPPSMHVDDFVAAESKEVVPSDGIPPPKRPLKVSQKISSRGGFSGNRGGRGAFHSQNRFFTPPASKGNYLCRFVDGLEYGNNRMSGSSLDGNDSDKKYFSVSTIRLSLDSGTICRILQWMENNLF